MVAFDHHAALWSRLKGGCRTLFGLDAAGQSDENQRQSRFQVEPLEPRILLSGDPVAGELARLVDDATHAMFVDDHAAVVEQVKTEIVADANHADHDSQSVVVSGSQAGDKRGVEWPAGWTSPNATAKVADAGKVDLRMAIANLVTAFAAQAPVEGAARGHVIAKLANSGPPDGTAPQAVTIEIERDGVSPSNALQLGAREGPDSVALATYAATQGETDAVRTLLKGVLDQVLAAFAAGSDDAAGQAAAAGLEIRIASLGAGEVARIEGNVILVDDDAGGAGWSLHGLAAADLAGLAIVTAAASDAALLAGPVPAVIARDTGPPASGDVVAVPYIMTVAVTVAAPVAATTADPAPVVASVARTEVVPVAVPVTVLVVEHATTAPAAEEAVTVAPTLVPLEAGPVAEEAGSVAVVVAPAGDGTIDPRLADAIVGLLAIAAAPAPVVDSRAAELRRAARTASSLSVHDETDDDACGTPSRPGRKSLIRSH